MKTITKILGLVLLSAVFTFAQQGDYSDFEGYVNFGSFEEFETGDEVTEIIIEENLLKMVSKMVNQNDEELKELLGGLKLIRVNTFETNTKNFNNLKERAISIDKQLMAKGWDRIVRTKTRSSVTNIYIHSDYESKINGLVVASVEENGEAAFVNIVGDIKLETIGKLNSKFNIPHLDSIKVTHD